MREGNCDTHAPARDTACDASDPRLPVGRTSGAAFRSSQVRRRVRTDDRRRTGCGEKYFLDPYRESEQRLPFIDLPDHRIHYAVSGSKTAPALILSNSLGTNFSMWDLQLPDFEESS